MSGPKFRPQDIIEKKRDGNVLTSEEIAFIIRGYTNDEIPDYQIAAWLMAVFNRGMNPDETRTLVKEMLHSGTVLHHNLSRNGHRVPLVDKHSTGGVGDKTSLVVAPVAAACGVAVPMISGRGLAHTGGTLDKLEAIPGFRTDLSLADFRKVLKRCGMALIGQTAEIAPADRKLYALRDLTATVPCPPLICGSIMSKKLAEGIDGLVLDVKCGNGAFMHSENEAKSLARLLARTAREMGKRCVALVTDMNQPLGRWIGNAVETREAIETLNGKLDGDFNDLSIELAARMIVVSGLTSSIASARKQAREAIVSGAARERFRENIIAQGGDPRVLDDVRLLPQAKYKSEIRCEAAGYVASIATNELGRVVMDWGGGRLRLQDAIDLSVGLEVHAKIGDKVQPGDSLVTAHHNDKTRLAEMKKRLASSYVLSKRATSSPKLIKAVI